MFILVSYDIGETDSKAGARRLRRIAKTCESYGQRVQFSVFEIKAPPSVWAKMRLKLLDLMDTDRDSLRFYYLAETTRHEHHGTKAGINLSGPLLF